MTIIESFIIQHFEPISNQIRQGLKGQDRNYFNRLIIDGRKNINTPLWELRAKDTDILKCISDTLHVLLHAGKIDENFADLERRTLILLKIACGCFDKISIDYDTYLASIISSEQMSYFLLDSIDWGKDIEEDIEHFKPRINFFKDELKNSLNDQKKKELDIKYNDDRLLKAQNLLYAMKAQRDPKSHRAIDLHLERDTMLQRLIYHLYDFITIVYITRHVIGNDFRNNVFDSSHAGVPNNPLVLDLCVRCNIDGVKSMCLHDILYDHSKPIQPKIVDGSIATFEVERFKKYQIAIVKHDGKKIYLPEHIEINHKYFNGCKITVENGDKGITKVSGAPPKMPLSELFQIDEKDLSNDFRYVLNELSRFKGYGQEVIPIVRSLILSLATKNKRDKEVFNNEITKMKEDMVNIAPEKMVEFLREQANKIQELLAKPYNEQGVKDLFNIIDDVYNKAYTAIPKVDDNYGGDDIIKQIYSNVERFLSGDILTISTSAVERTIEIQRDLTKFDLLLNLSNKYPQIIEAELGPHWLLLKIIDLYVDRTNWGLVRILELQNATETLCKYVTDKAAPNSTAYVCANMLKDSLLTHAEHAMLWAIFGEPLINDWIQKIQLDPSDEKFKELKDAWSKEYWNFLSINQKNELFTISLSNFNKEDQDKAMALFDKLKELVEKMQQRVDLFNKEFDEITRRRLEKLKGIRGKFAKTFRFADWVPELKDDAHAKQSFENYKCLCNNYDVERLLQLIWADEKRIFVYHNWQFIINPEGLAYEWADYYIQWRDENKIIFHELDSCIFDLRFLTMGKQRVRKNASLYQNDIDLLSQKVDIILKYQIKLIKERYNPIPDYIRTVSNSKILPSHIKIMLLRWVLEPEAGETLNLLYLIDEVMDCWPYADFDCRFWVFRKYVTEYSKLLFSDEIIKEWFPLLTDRLKKKYIHLLLLPHPWAGNKPYFNISLAIILNQQYHLGEEQEIEKAWNELSKED